MTHLLDYLNGQEWTAAQIIRLREALAEVDATFVQKLTRLTSLDLAHNNIDEVGAVVATQLTNLTSLNLALNSIGDAGCGGAGYSSQAT